MKIDLTGRTALVTGSTQGIGFAIATGLAAAGAEVVVNGRTEDKARAAAERIDGATRVVAADVGTAEGCRALVEAVPDVDVLVNNAAVFTPTPVFEIADEDWQRHFDVNVMSGVRLTRHHAPRMADRGWGRVIFVSSESALQIPVEMVQYGMSKTAQLAVSRGMAEALPGRGVTINCILPGPTRTEAFEGMIGSVDDVDQAGRDFIASDRPTSLLGRLLDPTEVANLAVYLVSEQASGTTGAALSVDGGVVRAIGS